MKVVAFNGSPRQGGNTTQMLAILQQTLQDEGVQTEEVRVCPGRPRGCLACMGCAQNKDRRCTIDSDPVNEWIAKMVEADGIVFASPTYFGSVSSEMKALIDRAGLVARVNGNLLRRKVGAAVVAVRRGGAITAHDTLLRAFQINEMVIPGSLYWNFGVGLRPGDVQEDDEGKENMVNLGQNMAWLLQRTVD